MFTVELTRDELDNLVNFSLRSAIIADPDDALYFIERADLFTKMLVASDNLDEASNKVR